ncbi:MAG: transporter suffix domain-containing protein [Gammaproteobacteria bacterium]|jgi:hypothetical protein
MKKTPKTKKGWKHYLGMILFIYSFAPYVAAAILPLVGVSMSEAVTAMTVAIVSGEVAFFISIVLLGKTIIHRMKAFFRKIFKRKAVAAPTTPQIVSKFRHRLGVILLILSALPYPLSEVAMFYGYPKSGQHIFFLWMLVAGDAILIASFLVLGAGFLEKVKALFRRNNIAMIQE